MMCSDAHSCVFCYRCCCTDIDCFDCVYPEASNHQEKETGGFVDAEWRAGCVAVFVGTELVKIIPNSLDVRYLIYELGDYPEETVCLGINVSLITPLLYDVFV